MSKPATWIVELEEDPETGDLILPIPPALMKELGWDPGDVLTWGVDEDNLMTLQKKKEK
jgi:hypothetical protein